MATLFGCLLTMQMEVGERHGPLDRIGCRRGSPSAEPPRLFPPDRVGQCVVVIIRPWIATGPRDGNRCDRRPAREQADRRRTRLERHSRGVERRRRAPITATCLPRSAAKSMAASVWAYSVVGSPSLTTDGTVRSVVPGEAGAEDDLPRRLDLGLAADVEVQPEMPIRRLDPQQPGAIADRDPEELTVPRQIVCQSVRGMRSIAA